MKDKKKVASLYFDAWNSHNTNNLKSFFSDDITLKDWEVQAEGIESVLNANQKIFDDVPTIKATPLLILSEDKNNFVIGVLNIDLPNETIEVVDVIEFDEKNKIKTIRAYRGH
jgi:hypothetical protein